MAAAAAEISPRAGRTDGPAVPPAARRSHRATGPRLRPAHQPRHRLAQAAVPQRHQRSLCRRLRPSRDLRAAHGAGAPHSPRRRPRPRGRRVAPDQHPHRHRPAPADRRRRKPENPQNLPRHPDARARRGALGRHQQGRPGDVALLLRNVPHHLRQRPAAQDGLVLHPAGGRPINGASGRRSPEIRGLLRPHGGLGVAGRDGGGPGDRHRHLSARRAAPHRRNHGSGSRAGRGSGSHRGRHSPADRLRAAARPLRGGPASPAGRVAGTRGRRFRGSLRRAGPGGHRPAAPVRHRHPGQPVRRGRIHPANPHAAGRIAPPGQPHQATGAHHRRHRQPAVQGQSQGPRRLGGERQRQPSRPARAAPGLDAAPRVERRGARQAPAQPLRLLLALGRLEGVRRRRPRRPPGPRARPDGHRLFHHRGRFPERPRLPEDARRPASRGGRNLGDRLLAGRSPAAHPQPHLSGRAAAGVHRHGAA